MKFSVILTVFINDKIEYFIDALSSIINQTLQPSEIIIVFDGPVISSIENYLENEIKSDLIKLYKLKKNLGRGFAKNYAINKTNYDYIALMDSDDISRSNRFYLQINYFKKFPDIDIIGGQIEEFHSFPGDQNSYRLVPRNNLEIYHQMKTKQAFNNVTIMFKKKLFLDLNGYNNFKYLEDYDFFFRAALMKSRFYNLQEILVDVRFNYNDYSKRKGLSYLKEEYKLLTDMKNSKFINKLIYVKNILIRTIIRFSPNFMISILYKNILRKQKHEKF